MVEVDRKLSTRPVSKDDYLEFINKELNPLIEKIRLATASNSDDLGMLGLIEGVATAQAGLLNTARIRQALTSANGGGIVTIPQGVYYLAQTGGVQGSSILSLVGSTKIWLRGRGAAQTTLIQLDGAESHILNIEGCEDIEISHLTVDGNSSNNTLGVHCIRVGTGGCSGLSIHDCEIRNAGHYGIGLQRGHKERVFLTNLYIHDVGGDGIDIKNEDHDNESIHISSIVVHDWGQDETLRIQAGIDCRGPCQLTNIWAASGPSDGNYIRFREGESTDASTGGHYSHLRNFFCYGNDGDESTGVYVAAHDVAVSGGYVRQLNFGVNVFGVRNAIADVVAESCLDESFRTELEGEDARFSNCTSYNCAEDGFRLRAPGVKMLGCFSSGDIVSGITTESTATEFGCTDFDCEGTGGTMLGVNINSANAQVLAGHIRGCFRGLSTAAVRTKFIGVDSQTNTGDGCIILVGGTDAVVMGCTLRNNGDDGLRLRDARARAIGNIIRSNTNNGVEIEATATLSRLECNDFRSNGTALADSGTGTRVGLTNDGLSTPYLLSSVRVLAGTGDPTGVHAAPIGSIFMRTDGGAGTSFYVNEDGTSAGWAAK